MLPSDKCPTPRKLLNDPNRKWDWQGQNAHDDDIPKFLRKLKREGCLQDCCAYCGVNLIESYDTWWAGAAVLDHLIPQSRCTFTPAIRNAASPEWKQFEKWVWDFSNAVLACSGCNSAAQDDMPPDTPSFPLDSLDKFYEVRDAVFTYRWHRIREKRDIKREAFECLLKELSDPDSVQLKKKGATASST